MLFRMIYDEKLAQAAYLIGCQRTGEAIIFDPERDVDRYIDLARGEDLRIVAVAETHIHADFLSGARELAERTGAKVYVSGEGGVDWQYGWLNAKCGGGAYDHQVLRDGDAFRVGVIEFKAIHTPGHTPEHLSYAVTDRGGGAAAAMGLITGDFVFVGDLGRPDLLETAAGQAGAREPSARTLFRSARKFVELPEYLQIWPAHGAGSACGKALGAVPQSTVGYEKRFNPAISAAGEGEEQFVRFILSGQPAPPLYFGRMKRENRDGPAVLGGLPRSKRISAAELRDLAARPDGAQVFLDTRPWKEFVAGHLPGALSAPLDKTFPTVAGSYVAPGAPMYLVVEEARVEEAVRDLVRVGLDDVRGFITPETLREHGAARGKLATTDEIEVGALRDRLARGEPVFLLDVRGVDEFAEGHIPGALNAPHLRLPERLGDVSKDAVVAVNCRSGVRSARATSLLERAGIRAMNVIGGFMAWEKAGGDIER